MQLSIVSMKTVNFNHIVGKHF